MGNHIKHITHKMCQFSEAYVKAVSSPFDIGFQETTQDYGTDIKLSILIKGKDNKTIDGGEFLRIQIKSTSQIEFNKEKKFKYSISKDTILRLKNKSITPIILVVMPVDKDVGNWMSISEALLLKHPAYWVWSDDIDADGSKAKTIYMDQVFCPTSFEAIIKTAKDNYDKLTR